MLGKIRNYFQEKAKQKALKTQQEAIKAQQKAFRNIDEYLDKVQSMQADRCTRSNPLRAGESHFLETPEGITLTKEQLAHIQAKFDDLNQLASDHHCTFVAEITETEERTKISTNMDYTKGPRGEPGPAAALVLKTP